MADSGQSSIDRDYRFGGGHFKQKKKKYKRNPFLVKSNPYGRGGRQAGDKGSHHGNTSGHPPHQASDEAREKSWFKVTILHGAKYDEGWIMGRIQGACRLPFTPVEFHYNHSEAHFYVDDAAVAKAINQISRTFTDREKYKVNILTVPCPRPNWLNDMSLEEIVHLKNCMQKRYDGAQQALNMQRIRFDPELMANKVDILLNRGTCMQAMLQIIEENIPELLSLDLSNNRLNNLHHLSELHLIAPNLKILNLSNNSLRSEILLDKIKDLKLEVLWLKGNRLGKIFKKQTEYISAMRDRFPKLLQLDGKDLSPPIAFDVDPPTTLPPCKGSYLASADCKALVLPFLNRYYACYDSEDRQSLLNLYHDEACCSLSIPGLLKVKTTSNSLGEYFRSSRNIKRIRDPAFRFNLLKHKRLNVVRFLNELPRTQHDLNSFVVDITAQTNTLLCFVVSGVFKVGGESNDLIRAFTRVFIAVPSTDGGLVLVNDEQLIRKASNKEVRKAFATPAPKPSSSPVPVLAQTHQDMVQAFSLFSGMNEEWSQKCLQENGWDFEKAAHIFMKLKAEGKIPEVAFIT